MPSPNEDRAPPFDSVSASIYAGIEPPERAFLDEASLLPSRNITMLSGDGSTGKSLLALQLGVAVAAESLWIGIGVAGGSVVYLCCEEDQAEIHARLRDIEKAEGIDLRDAANLNIIHMAGQDATLAVERRNGSLQATPQFARLVSTLEDFEPALVILDNLADIFSGNENNRSQVKQFITLLRGLAIRHDCVILLLAHPSLTGLASGSGTSGSTAWSNSVRSRLYLRREIDGDGTEVDETQRLLEVKKLNYSAKGRPYGLKWRDGRFIRSDAPKPFDNVSTADLERVQQAFAAGSFRVDERSSDWGGYAVANVLDLDIGRGIGTKERSKEQNRARDKVRVILATWLQNKALTVVDGRTERREKTQFFGVSGGTR